MHCFLLISNIDIPKYSSLLLSLFELVTILFENHFIHNLGGGGEG